ncbi:AMP-binding protein, partial [Dyella silvatica]|uniref:AMP-binding protein n=1 Tax=Dyella silvatica TaxID=2992128 RepID=UPI00225A5BD0
MFEQQVAYAPDAVALRFGDQQLSYAQLNARANRLAHWLTAQGAAPEQLVGIALTRSFEMIASLLAVLKSGAAYLPLDPDYPPRRLEAMLQDAKPLLVLSTHDTGLAASSAAPFFYLDQASVAAALAAQPDDYRLAERAARHAQH